MRKRARRTPYVSLLPRRNGAVYLMWNIGSALMQNPAAVSIEVGHYLDNSSRFQTFKKIGPPQTRGGTFIHLPEGSENLQIVARIVCSERLGSSQKGRSQELFSIYAVSRPVPMVRRRPLANPARFAKISISPTPLIGRLLTAEEITAHHLSDLHIGHVEPAREYDTPSSGSRYL